MLRGEDAVGGLGIANHREREFTEEETTLLVEIGRELARERAS